MSQRKEALVEKLEDEEYKIGFLPPRKAQAILVEMTKVAGPTLAALAAAAQKLDDKKNVLDADIDFGHVVQIFVEKMSSKMLDEHQAAFAAVTEVDGKPLARIFDAHFQGRVSTMLKWHALAIKANYQDFWDALTGVFARIPTADPVKADPSLESKPS